MFFLSDWVVENVHKTAVSAHIGYIMYRSLGDLLPAAYDPKGVR